jgi:hypothetical protein
MIVLGIVLILVDLLLLHTYILLVIGILLLVLGIFANYWGARPYAGPGPAPWYRRRWY